MSAPLLLVGGKREGDRRGGNPFTPSIPAQGLLTGIPSAGGNRKRGKGKEESCPLIDSGHPPYILKVSIAGPLDLACLKGPQQTSL
jgi:hypothetical protein